jgi:hypothetical protein
MKKTTRKGGTQKPAARGSYERVGNNIYFDGYSYRVRVSVNGERLSRNFTSKTAAYKFRKEMLQEQGTFSA